MIKDLISQITIFNTLTDSEQEEIAKITHVRAFHKSNHLFYQQDEMKYFFFILEGNIKIYRISSGGREQIVNFFGAGEMVPHHAIFRDDPYPANAVSMNETTVLMISKQDFETLLKNQSDIMMKMFKYLGSMIVDLQNRLYDKILHPADEQLLRSILRLAGSYGEDIDENNSLITLRVTKQDIGSMIGLSRETVSRNISLFKKLGLMYENKEGFIILNTGKINDYITVK
ncbi:Anaerobic regulatory protein [Jeotgalicoccus aerolatus]|jgi:CRP/FNR family transcriptional regulator, cyclic AMP receptor protein|uniref:HTH-type transcriptional regulator ArcR n=1 Tax=Jeotgalicoccus aerolatus TaxID=709510 RepID=A0A1G9E9Y6_9STAP|nr:Crp/Fnr family transcriptional regulator [Jeotgalicoccus aerolatus]MBP1951278.1 CRP/FNR family transcriptional regulator [Jeotgalicoccus aerolatus]NMA80530.1 Crp/Fnr family transcriptional regulator [Jeotgalicoccus aerolatus]CAD2077335.1 Anaerobic regulatory protein [Jeotgalicoccus aerolatus]SDK72953.1 CRP/FNR family transcriptional regulator, anaerobic regulatory protein [Jeotgalicoccus aerolatus]GGD98731.1 CarD family transcriptional regulator [Jeotgalicoccus aerolatus]